MELIETTSDLILACERLRGQDYIAIDTEFLRETTYWPKLCLIQVAASDIELIIDPILNNMDLSPLLEIMLDETITKVFHAPRQDIEIFYRLMKGKLPIPVFDSQTAAMALGLGEQVAYDTLVKSLLGHTVDKSSRFTDWSRRPLTENQLNYAIADVTHLRDMYPIMLERLNKLNRLEWISEEMESISNPLTYDTTPTNAWKRMKPKRFSAEYLAAFYAVTTWREWFAQEKDIPRGRVLKDDGIFEIAEQKPKNIEALDRLRAVQKGFSKSSAASTLLEALNEALENPEEIAPKAQKPKPNPAGIGATIELLKVLLRSVCEELEVAPKLIASNSDLEAVAIDDNPDSPIMTGWRYEVFGKKAIQLKHGRLGLIVDNRRVKVIELENETINA